MKSVSHSIQKGEYKQRFTLTREGTGALISAGASVKEYLGKYRGVVVNNRDPLKQGRVQVRVPAVLGESTLRWAMPCMPYAGPEEVGFFTIPPEKARVWVEFEAGDPNRLSGAAASGAKATTCRPSRGPPSRRF